MGSVSKYPEGAYHLAQSVGLVDLSARSRLCVVGADRARFLHGQLTNDIRCLGPGQGTYSAITTAKGKFEADAFVLVLEEEILLDLEPGLAGAIQERLERYIVSDDVEVIDVSRDYLQASLQGPRSIEVVRAAFPDGPWETMEELAGRGLETSRFGEIYVSRRSRWGALGWDLFVPADRIDAVLAALRPLAEGVGGGLVDEAACEARRIEAAVPRFGVDFDANALVPEAGIQDRAVSYQKGCYIGQETLNRIRAIGRVNRQLVGWEWTVESGDGPQSGDPLVDENGKKLGVFTSVLASERLQRNLALGYVRRERLGLGQSLAWAGEGRSGMATQVGTPFDRGAA